MRTKRLLFALLIAIGLGFASAASEELCFSKGEQVDGLNKICFYKCPSGNAAITIKSYQICPVSIKR